MLESVIFTPNENDILYHYCDSFSFHAICQNRKLWFNDLFSMNDSLELYWGYSIWERAAGTKIEQYGEEFLNEIDNVIHQSGRRGLLLVSCYSPAFVGVLLQQNAPTPPYTH